MEKYLCFIVSQTPSVLSSSACSIWSSLSFQLLVFSYWHLKVPHLCSLSSCVLLSIIGGTAKACLDCSEGLFLEICRALDTVFPLYQLQLEKGGGWGRNYIPVEGDIGLLCYLWYLLADLTEMVYTGQYVLFSAGVTAAETWVLVVIYYCSGVFWVPVLPAEDGELVNTKNSGGRRLGFCVLASPLALGL